MQIAKKAGIKIILNPAPYQDVSDELLGMANVLTPNEIEAEAFTGIAIHNGENAKAAANILHAKGVEAVVITMGKQGVFVSDTKENRLIPAHIVDAVDTTGAGDAFNGGFVAALAENRSIFEAAEFGNAVASLSIQKFGTAPSMPTRREPEVIWQD